MSKRVFSRVNLFRFLLPTLLVSATDSAIATDLDCDGMSCEYEDFFHLNPTNAEDALQNLDTDTLLNYQEALLWTDPRSADTDVDLTPDGEDSNALSRAVMWWGNPDFTFGDEYCYTGPEWWLGAGRIGGEWISAGGWQVDTNNQGMLYVDIDRTLIVSNLMLNLLHQNAAGSQVYLDLKDTNNTLVAVNLYGDLTVDDGNQVLSRYILPLTDYPDASRIVIDARAGAEPYSVWSTTLYEDMDADGLDSDQELQFGTSDLCSDSDGDGLDDFSEVMVYFTNPSNPDTDGDGLSDGDEILTLGTSATIPVWKDGGLQGLLQADFWQKIPGNTMGWLRGSKLFGNTASKVLWTSTSEVSGKLGRYYGLRMRGTITAPESGLYTFHLTGDDVVQVWLSDNGSPYNRRLVMELHDWTNFEDLSDPDASQTTIQLTNNQVCYVEVLLKQGSGGDHVSLWWTRPGTFAPEVIGSEYLHSYIQPDDDADMDGLPDDWELSHDMDPNDGTGGGYLDHDGNGLMDIEDYQFERNPIWSGYPGKLLADQWGSFLGETILTLIDSDLFG